MRWCTDRLDQHLGSAFDLLSVWHIGLEIRIGNMRCALRVFVFFVVRSYLVVVWGGVGPSHNVLRRALVPPGEFSHPRHEQIFRKNGTPKVLRHQNSRICTHPKWQKSYTQDEEKTENLPNLVTRDW